MKCVACQTEIEASSVYCPKCGAKLEDPDGQGTEQQFGQEETQQPLADEVRERTGPGSAEQGTASQRLLDTARSGVNKPAKTGSGRLGPRAATPPRPSSPLPGNLLCYRPPLGAISLADVEEGMDGTFRPLSLVDSDRRAVDLVLLYPDLSRWNHQVSTDGPSVLSRRGNLQTRSRRHRGDRHRRLETRTDTLGSSDQRRSRHGEHQVGRPDQPELKLLGLENPDVVFQALDDARRKERTTRGSNPCESRQLFFELDVQFRRWRELGMLIAFRYFVTVRRATVIPCFPSSVTS